jgi:hypothetical protein
MSARTLSKLAPLEFVPVRVANTLSAAIDPRRAFAAAPPNLGARQNNAAPVRLSECPARIRIGLPIESSWPSAPSQGIAIAPASSVRWLDTNGRANADAEVWLKLRADNAGGRP